VWFDALINYVSTIGWPENEKEFEKWWPVVQFAGKDQVRQQAAMWQAMLMSAGLPPSKQIYIHGFLTVGGEKISKSVGNVISPFEVVEKYGTDALRYFYLRHVHPFEDSDVSWEAFDEWYTAGLVNGLGNLVARVMKLAEQHLEEPIDTKDVRAMPDVWNPIEKFEFNRGMDSVWSYIQDLDGLIQEQKPFEVVKTNTIQGQKQIKHLVIEIARIAKHLEPFMPETSEKILAAIHANKKPENLFPRLT